MNENSVCHSFQGEAANDTQNSWIGTSLCVDRQEKELHLGLESHVGLMFLLLLSDDIELYPGSYVKCFTCSKSIRKSQSQEKCFHCGGLFHLNCLFDEIKYGFEKIVCKILLAIVQFTNVKVAAMPIITNVCQKIACRMNPLLVILKIFLRM